MLVLGQQSLCHAVKKLQDVGTADTQLQPENSSTPSNATTGTPIHANTTIANVTAANATSTCIAGNSTNCTHVHASNNQSSSVENSITPVGHPYDDPAACFAMLNQNKNVVRVFALITLLICLTMLALMVIFCCLFSVVREVRYHKLAEAHVLINASDEEEDSDEDGELDAPPKRPGIPLQMATEDFHKQRRRPIKHPRSRRSCFACCCTRCCGPPQGKKMLGFGNHDNRPPPFMVRQYDEPPQGSDPPPSPLVRRHTRDDKILDTVRKDDDDYVEPGNSGAEQGVQVQNLYEDP
jgi:hypothetical protein